MEQNELNERIKDKYQSILELQFKDKFYELEFLVNDILKTINQMMESELDKERREYLFMKYSVLIHTRHKEVSYVTNNRQSRISQMRNLKLAIKQIELDLLGLI